MRRIDPSMPREVAKRILDEESADLKARWNLSLMAEREYNAGNYDGSCTLMHAMAYLGDREAYEKEPWPKGKIKLPITSRPRCSHR